METKYISTGRFVVDRFEGDYAVLECSATYDTVDLLQDRLPKSVRPGDVLICKNGQWSVDHDATEGLKAEISDLFNRIKRKNM